MNCNEKPANAGHSGGNLPIQNTKSLYQNNFFKDILVILLKCTQYLLCNAVMLNSMKGILIALKFWLVLSIKWCQKNIIDFLLDLTFGTSTRDGTRNERKKRLQYENSAQLVQIWTRGAYSAASLHSPTNFVYTHEKYCHPNEVLKSDNITLMVSIIFKGLTSNLLKYRLSLTRVT